MDARLTILEAESRRHERTFGEVHRALDELERALAAETAERRTAYAQLHESVAVLRTRVGVYAALGAVAGGGVVSALVHAVHLH